MDRETIVSRYYGSFRPGIWGYLGEFANLNEFPFRGV